MLKKTSTGIITGVIVLVGCFGGYKVYANNIEQKHYQEALTAINRLFDDKGHKILADHVNTSLLNTDEKKIDILKDKNNKIKLNRELNKARLLLDNEVTAKKKVNDLFKDGVLVDQVTGQQIDIAQKLVSALTDHKLQVNLQSKLDTAKLQLTSQSNAEKAVLALFADVKHAALADKVNRSSYNHAKQLLDGVQNQTKKKELSGLLASADSLLTKAEKDQAKASEVAIATSNSNGSSKTGGTTNSSSSSNDSNKTGSTTNFGGSSNSSISSVNSNQAAQTGFAGIVAKSKTAQKTDQIVTVVASGTYANVTLWEKTNNQWGAVFSTGGNVGAQGVGHASEGSNHTPRGSYTLGFSFGQSNPGTKLPFRQITPNSYWISDVNSNLYNTWQEGNYAGNGNEHLADYENLQYYYAIVINYNTSRVKGVGSGFFLHVSNGLPTAGCVAVPKSYMEQFMKRIHSGAYIINVTSEGEVANY
ncbi:toxin Cry1Ac domain D-VI-related protein [Neobacillus ginsengisoli]|uniref:L,D-peptidoglycan transpeptidase YkuD (ErfK/YbiS/YcfS/YnhG family) n=1 Tax=Neobacillus ginsengisoli TaxID=904295 RepID=A0ABT9XZF0_9BACI|nr:toxin Cry1Ac domain D-VI-related protein [Neobacillus ginsengisoli]MDQ0200716.1 L,D-peptidoglycan transpeptidase YkuD (ErfK/YbiS/YcfS/YnhG family) [Neobacillus ginsengisoli]